MKPLYQISVLACAVAVGGCTSEKAREAALARMGDEVPPEFLVGPASAALTNLDGFSATITSTVTSDAVSHDYSGQILEREGLLFFQPMATVKSKKGKIARGGMMFMWNTASARGNIVSEALQGYAPLPGAVHLSTVSPVSDALASEPINGHPCHKVERTVTMSDGSNAKVTEWLADDLNHAPVRIRSDSGGNLVTVELTDVRILLPAPELFSPPLTFTRYESPLALINELLIRESPLKTGPTTAVPGVPNEPANWREPGGVGRTY